MTDETLVVETPDASKLTKARTSLTLSPDVFEWVKEEAKTQKTSVSQIVEDLLVDLRSKKSV